MDSDRKVSAAEFFTSFKQRVADIRVMIESLKAVSEIDEVRLAVRGLEVSVREASAFLPQYDQRIHSKTISELSDELNAAQERLRPKGRFSFKYRKPPAGIVDDDKPKVASPATPVVASKDTKATAYLADMIVQDLVDRYVSSQDLLQEHQTKKASIDTLIQKCRGSLVNLSQESIDISTIHIVDCQDTLIILRNVSGSVFVENCRRVHVVASCQQLRVHSSTDLHFYIHIPSHPIIEDCSGISFSKYSLQGVVLQGENQYANVDDFNWIKQEHSPNWKLSDRQPDWDTLLSSDSNDDTMVLEFKKMLAM